MQQNVTACYDCPFGPHPDAGEVYCHHPTSIDLDVEILVVNQHSPPPALCPLRVASVLVTLSGSVR